MLGRVQTGTCCACANKSFSCKLPDELNSVFSRTFWRCTRMGNIVDLYFYRTLGLVNLLHLVGPSQNLPDMSDGFRDVCKITYTGTVDTPASWGFTIKYPMD